MNKIQDRLNLLKKWIREENADGIYLTHQNFFGLEFPSKPLNYLEWITGFTGSAGKFLLIQGKAAIFLDSRYTIQGKEELENSGVEVHPLEGFSKFLPKYKNKTIIYCSKLVRLEERSQLEKYQCKWKPIDRNPFEILWNRRANFVKLAVPFLFESWEDGHKYQRRVLAKVKKLPLTKGESLLICSPENVNWLLEIRGQDTPYTPLFVSFAIVQNLKEGRKVHLIANPIRVKNIPLEKSWINVDPDLKGILKQLSGVVKIDKQETPCHVENLLSRNKNVQIEYCPNPCNRLKAIKSPREIQGMKDAHIQDAVAVINFIYWLQLKKFKVTELEAERKLDKLRLENTDCTGLSFRTISASGKRAALCHYNAKKNSRYYLSDEQIYLVDSGGQYRAGTTDVTRTISCGDNPAPELCKRFTQVLKGHIKVATSSFPKGTSGANLDSFARSYLWEDGLDFEHSTGHGVGCALNVHEGPQALSAKNTFPLQENMILSNEPGFYKEGHYGIRIENVVMVVKSEKPRFLNFKNLTLVPIDKNLIDLSLLSQDEIAWVDRYHSLVLEKIEPLLSTNKKKMWLRRATSPVQLHNGR